eukprot:8264736-Alexandrium_andersonii.AAC.1
MRTALDGGWCGLASGVLCCGQRLMQFGWVVGLGLGSVGQPGHVATQKEGVFSVWDVGVGGGRVARGMFDWILKEGGGR